MIEKIAHVVRFLELMLNPTEGPTPMFIYAMIKSINHEMKKEIESLYKELSGVEITSLSLDVVYNEKEEIRFICDIFKIWSKHKVQLKDITKKLSMSWSKEKADRGYLG